MKINDREYSEPEALAHIKGLEAACKSLRRGVMGEVLI